MTTPATVTTELLVVEQLNPVALFTGQAMDPLIGQIKARVEQHVPDVSTAKGRHEIASLAYKVARSKTVLDDLGKQLVAEMRERCKKVDDVRRDMRDRLDALRDQARLPLDNYEKAEEARLIQEALDKRYDADWEEAQMEYAFRERERILALMAPVELKEPETQLNRRAIRYREKSFSSGPITRRLLWASILMTYKGSLLLIPNPCRWPMVYKGRPRCRPNT